MSTTTAIPQDAPRDESEQIAAFDAWVAKQPRRLSTAEAWGAWLGWMGRGSLAAIPAQVQAGNPINQPRSDSQMIAMTQAEYDDLKKKAAERDALHALINTPELIDFPKAVHIEAVHQEQRWGTVDREGKMPHNWHWLVAHLAGRALEHHKEADRLAEENALAGDDTIAEFVGRQIAHHREKAVHHTITAAAALNHWHASIVGKCTAMRPGSHHDGQAESAFIGKLA